MSTVRFLWLPVLWLFLVLLTPVSSRESPTGPRREQIVARQGVVATDDGRCSDIGMKVLEEGGHAVDAAVAAAFCLGVVSPASSGIGGGAFMLIRLANGTTQALDMRETAPMSASENMYHGNHTLKRSGILSVAVPGEIMGLRKAWEQHGKLRWERLVEPAEALARNGFKVSPFLRMQMERAESYILADKGLRDVFTSNGAILKIGDICRNIKLADTLGKISKHGLNIFYNGSVGINLVQDIQKAGGILTIRDLQRYQVKMREPITANILGFKLIGMPPPSSGPATMMLMLNILSDYGVPADLFGPLGIHRQIEALKHSFGVRMNLGDPDFVDTSEVLADMLSPIFSRALQKTIRDNMILDVNHYGSRWNQIDDHGTSHVSIVDNERNAVAMTTTINAYFGAKILSPSTGIVVNNQMDDFSIPNGSASKHPPAPANFIRPGKRPLSSMTPTIVLKDEKLRGVVGASGGANIISATAQALLNHFINGMDPLSSVMAPRYYQQLTPNIVYYENWTSVIDDHYEMGADVVALLQHMGHDLESMGGGAVCQFVVHELETAEEINGGIGRLVGVSDPRKGGIPAGY
ncbi:Gamma-glutamyltranspeptidase [Melia azedarach]|uniref:Gamma-glutamyltranspeptidase n=1 Tax=Melia azedarach TaxID=155640 RepID=A0ACC1XZC0_MELAZ|nr:Gamma-glutamyltranspeptidase [Melia azedarach]